MPTTPTIENDRLDGRQHRPTGDDDEAARKAEQKSAMQKVREGKTLYDMLGVSRTASYGEIVKSYRRLALLLHPDKNKVPGSAECFKAVARAFKVLGDSKSRHEYDLSLSHPTTTGPRQPRGNGYVYRRGPVFNVWSDEDDDFSAEAFFNAFFASHTGLAFPTRRYYHSNAAGTTRVQRGEEPFLFKFAAMAVLVALMLMSAFLTPEHAYQFSPSMKYSARRTTQKLKINYYVQPDFSVDAEELTAFEAEVEMSYLAILHRQCHEEQERRIRSFRNQPTPSCDLYRTLMARA